MAGARAATRPPSSLTLLTIAAAPFGAWLAADGLSIRLFGAALEGGGALGLWRLLPSALGLSIAALGWPLVVLGTAWFGALAGLWFRLGWARRAALALAVASLAHVGIGTALGAVALICLSDRKLRDWLEAPAG
jgi:hypothetical protein